MRDLFEKFLASPDRESYMAVRAALLSSASYDPDSEDLFAADELIAAGRVKEARKRLVAAMPNLLLSPRAHLMLADIALQSGDENRHQFERFVAATCCEGILATGDGTREHPYFVLRVADEYDVLAFLDRQSRMQALVAAGSRELDHLCCTDGSDVWFDVTEAYQKIA